MYSFQFKCQIAMLFMFIICFQWCIQLSLVLFDWIYIWGLILISTATVLYRNQWFQLSLTCLQQLINNLWFMFLSMQRIRDLEDKTDIQRRQIKDLEEKVRHIITAQSLTQMIKMFPSCLPFFVLIWMLSIFLQYILAVTLINTSFLLLSFFLSFSFYFSFYSSLLPSFFGLDVCDISCRGEWRIFSASF